MWLPSHTTSRMGKQDMNTTYAKPFISDSLLNSTFNPGQPFDISWGTDHTNVSAATCSQFTISLLKNMECDAANHSICHENIEDWLEFPSGLPRQSVLINNSLTIEPDKHGIFQIPGQVTNAGTWAARISYNCTVPQAPQDWYFSIGDNSTSTTLAAPSESAISNSPPSQGSDGPRVKAFLHILPILLSIVGVLLIALLTALFASKRRKTKRAQQLKPTIHELAVESTIHELSPETKVGISIQTRELSPVSPSSSKPYEIFELETPIEKIFPVRRDTDEISSIGEEGTGTADEKGKGEELNNAHEKKASDMTRSPGTW